MPQVMTVPELRTALNKRNVSLRDLSRKANLFLKLKESREAASASCSTILPGDVVLHVIFGDLPLDAIKSGESDSVDLDF